MYPTSHTRTSISTPCHSVPAATTGKAQLVKMVRGMLGQGWGVDGTWAGGSPAVPWAAPQASCSSAVPIKTQYTEKKRQLCSVSADQALRASPTLCGSLIRYPDIIPASYDCPLTN